MSQTAMSACNNMYMYVCMYVSLCIYICMYVYMYVHTYVHVCICMVWSVFLTRGVKCKRETVQDDFIRVTSFIRTVYSRHYFLLIFM